LLLSDDIDIAAHVDYFLELLGVPARDQGPG
jgi:hypothetical protein